MFPEAAKELPRLLNWIWLALILIAVLCAAFTGRMAELTNATLSGAKDAVTLAIGLIGVMAFFLGAMKVLQDGGFLNTLARKLKPVMAWLFPGVPVEHPAMSAMILNISSNMLGLGNAATPFGIKAMTELEKLNEEKGVASNAMCLFLAINTSALAILPSGVISMRASLNSSQPAAILLTTLIATALSTTIAVIAAKFLQKLPFFSVAAASASSAPAPAPEPDEEPEPDKPDAMAAIEAEAAAAPREKAHIAIRISIGIFVAVLLLALGLHIQKEMGPPPPNTAPTATALIVTTEKNTALEFQLKAEDPDEDDTLTFAIVEQPGSGAITGTGPGFTYTPAEDFTGEDKLTFTVSDGTETSDEAEVAIRVVYVPPPTFASKLGTVLRSVASFWLLPALIVAILLYGVSRKVKIYESLVEGAKEGFNVAIIIIPYLVAILVAVAMFRASGAMDILVNGLAPITGAVGMPAEALPMAVVRPLSGTGAYGVMTEIMQNNGPDSFVGLVVSTMQGSTDTTFYILAVYFGAAQVRATRHALPACLIADIAGVAATVAICWLMFGGRGL